MNPVFSKRKMGMITLDEAIESAKLSAGYERILRQQHYDDLLAQLPPEEHYPFTMALVELGIHTRTGQRLGGLSPSEQEIEDRIVGAARHLEAGWWDDLKTKVKEWTGWGDDAAEEYVEDQYGVSEPTPMEEEITPPPPGFPPEQEVEEDLSQVVPEEEAGEYAIFEGFELPDEGEMPVMHPVESSNIEAIGYDEEDEMLYVAFTAKRTTPRTLYRYFNVSPEEFSNFLAADSKGKYFHQNIRETKFYDKLDIGNLAY